MIVLSLSAMAIASSPTSAFRPHNKFSEYAGLHCSNSNLAQLSGNSQTKAWDVLLASFVAEGSISSNDSIKVSGNGFIDGDAIPAPEHNVIINGNGSVTGSMIPAEELVDCSIGDLLILSGWGVKENHINNQIPVTNTGRLPWECDMNPAPPPGADGPWNFCLKENETVHISAGIYWFSSWTQRSGSRIILDGYVRILVTGPMHFEGDATVNAEQSPHNLLIFYYPESPLELKLDGDAVINGLLYSPFSNAHLTGKSILNGNILAHELKTSGQSQLIRWVDTTASLINVMAPSILCINNFDVSVGFTISDMESGG